MNDIVLTVESVADSVPDSWWDDARGQGGNVLALRVAREFGVSEFVGFHVSTIVARRVGVARGWLS